jgi:hypothetical protein
MDETVARLNIEHFRKLLARERDDAKRATLLQLLAEEEAKLETLLRRARGAKDDPARAAPSREEPVQADPDPTIPASGSDEPQRARRSRT